MPLAKVNGINIFYEQSGAVTAPAILMIHGLGMPHTGWTIGWRQRFVEQGFQVICLDNRDVGRSELFDQQGRPPLLDILSSSLLKRRTSPPYQLKDMAEDVVGLLDYLGINQAHILGVSMGGMIAQRVGIHYPERVLSLTLIMTMTGDRSAPKPSIKVQWMLLTQPRTKDQAKLKAHSKKTWRTIGSPDYPPSERELDAYVDNLFAQGIHPEGTLRQLSAILAEGDRSQLLKKIKLPTLIVHGDKDPLLPVACGKQLAECIPSSNLHIEPGMGHDLPAPLINKLSGIIVKHIIS